MKHNRKKKIILSAVFTLVFSAAVSLGNVKDVSAGTDTLTLKAGFYGGPYYEVEVYDDAEMRSLADNNVWTYSGCDTGNFMRVCYAWGVPLETLIADAGIDLNSVKYLHFGTTDSYQEIYATFSASTLLADRYFYPDFVKAATTEDPLQITLDYSKVDSTIAGNRYKVPTILAIGSTGFSREEAASVLSRQAYLSPTQSELPETFKFRLLYGQLGITSGAAAYNVQTSDKWVYEINVQLAGSPNLVVNRELISGNAGEVGSKYKLTVTAELPSSYNYLSSSIRSALSQQVLQSVQNSYDSSKVKITDLGNGTYEMEVLSEGEINVDFSYSRTDYGGDVVTASAGTSMTATNGSGNGNGSGDADDNGSNGSGGTQSGNNTNQSGNGSTSTPTGSTSTQTGNSSTQNGINIGTSSKDYTSSTSLKNSSNTNSSSNTSNEDTSDSSEGISEADALGSGEEASATGATWATTSLADITDETTMEQQDTIESGVLAAGAAGLFILGVARSVLDFLINIGKVNAGRPNIGSIKETIKNKFNKKDRKETE